MRVGVIGCGYWGSKHARVLAERGGTEVLVYDGVPERRDRIAADHGVKAAPSLDLLFDHCEAVVIATPAESHAGLATEALDRGLHVLVEKPLATRSADAQAMVDLAARKNRVLAVGHTFLYHPAVSALRQLVKRGDLGEIRYVQSSRLNLGNFQPDTNVIWDLAPHDLSIFDHVLGCSPTAVDAVGRRHAGGGNVDTASITLSYGNRELAGYVSVGWLHPTKVRQLTVVGSLASAVFDDMADQPLVVHESSAEVQHDPASAGTAVYRVGETRPVPVASGEPLAMEVDDFLTCAATGRRPVSDGHRALAIVAALAAADECIVQSRSGIPIPGGDVLARDESLAS